MRTLRQPPSDDLVHRRLDEVYAACAAKPDVRELARLKLIVFSDHHRGQGDGADDFAACQATYHAALGWYLELGFTLVLLGDVEELWECMPFFVCRKYADTLRLEQRFAPTRLVRIRGNHDEEWAEGRYVRRHLGKYLSRDPKDRTGFPLGHLIEVRRGDTRLGQILLVHGHQGTRDGDRFATLCRFVVRYAWRPVQRVLRWPSTTPATNFRFRDAYERTMHHWVKARPGVVLIAGHSHRPVFDSETDEERLRAAVQGAPDAPARAAARAQLEYALAQAGGAGGRIPGTRSGFFNTGCCSFSDGRITGIELEGDRIRLIQWTANDGEPARRVCAEGSLLEVLAAPRDGEPRG